MTTKTNITIRVNDMVMVMTKTTVMATMTLMQNTTITDMNMANMTNTTKIPNMAKRYGYNDYNEGYRKGYAKSYGYGYGKDYDYGYARLAHGHSYRPHHRGHRHYGKRYAQLHKNVVVKKVVSKYI